MAQDHKYMKIALRLAARGRGKTSPNPTVGAVIVKNGSIIAKGVHKRAGLDHAEVDALKKAGPKAVGATLYVTLEPCSHYGKTPPCTDAIIKSGIKRVIIAAKDPNPITNGKSINKLRSKNIRVDLGILEDESKALNEAFNKFITKKMPFVTIKVAQSLDGKIATNTGQSKWITSEQSRKAVHKLRASVDAVLTSSSTVIKDNPLLTARSFGKNPVKVIVDSRLSTPLNSRIFSDDSPGKTIIATTKYAPKSRLTKYRKTATVIIVKDKSGLVDIKDLLRKLARLEITSILVEGGGNLAASFIENKLADKIIFFIAPKIIGGKDAPTSVEGAGISNLASAVRLRDIKVKRIGEDFLVEGYIS